jgi:FKBP-type peptidyl-prolyl cis-trans isomerase FklB
MKLKLLVLITFVSFATQTLAEESVVIDSSTLGQQPTAADTNGDVPVQQTDAPNAAPPVDAEANKERVLKSGKLSTRQRTAVVKAELTESNKQESDNYLALNRDKQGVRSLASGVQYEVLKAGKGRKPNDASVLECRFRGTLTDGTEFDKSDGNKPVAVYVSAFLPGLREAVKLMPAGSKWQITIPPQLAYGDRGNRGVGPNAVVIYEMEIFNVK